MHAEFVGKLIGFDDYVSTCSSTYVHTYFLIAADMVLEQVTEM
jgi:hypothetical protein